MIQKRYEYYGPNGIQWTDWFNYSKEDSLLKVFQKEEKWQVMNKLRNEFRLA